MLLARAARFLRQQEEFGAPVIHLADPKLPVFHVTHTDSFARTDSTVSPLGVRGSGVAGPVRTDAAQAIVSPQENNEGSGVEPASEGPGARLEAPQGAAPDAPQGAAARPLPNSLQELRAHCSACTQCGLSAERTQTVFADGTPDARVMVVGEAPGANEDASGLPFVGAAGKLLDLLLATVGLSRRDSVYICNVVKCRPPGNRNPEPHEIAACAPYLRRQIELVQPEVILAVGTFAGKLLSGKDLPLGALRGSVHAFEGIPLVVTYHPAALLRNSGWIRPTWSDVQRLRATLDREGAKAQSEVTPPIPHAVHEKDALS